MILLQSLFLYTLASDKMLMQMIYSGTDLTVEAHTVGDKTGLKVCPQCGLLQF